MVLYNYGYIPEYTLIKNIFYLVWEVMSLQIF